MSKATMSIDRIAYTDHAYFEKEMARLFADRIFIGSRFDLAEENDYRTIQIGNHAITVRNTGSGVRAFNNVCLHRNALIDPPGSGNRQFRCNYHGWCYDNNGVLELAPLNEVNAINERHLSAYPVSEANGLYFLGHENPPNVSDVALAFDETHSVLTKPFCSGVLDHACNWKLLVENVLEGYHLSYVHRNTFVQAGFASTSDYRHAMHEGISWSTMMPKSGGQRDKSHRYSRISAEAGHFYKHAFVFPNFFLANSNGLIGFQSSLHPTNATNTRMEWSLFELPALVALATPIREHFRNDAIAFANASLLEDKVLVESCQLGLSSVGKDNQFQPNEGRIAHFHAMYAARLGLVSEQAHDSQGARSAGSSASEC